MRRVISFLVLWICVPVCASAQSETTTPELAKTGALTAYVGTDAAQFELVARAARNGRDTADLLALLPVRRTDRLVRYVRASRDFGAILADVDSMRLNKLVGSAPGLSGTALVSHVAAPAVLGLGIEYGSILQQSTGTITTLRANLLGVGRMIAGNEQFPYCPELAQSSCNPLSRHLRRFSASVGFEDTRKAPAPGTAAPASAAPTVEQLLGSDFRIAVWGARFDLTPSNNLDDPKFLTEWSKAIGKLRSDPAAAELTRAIQALLDKSVTEETYTAWQADTLTQLNQAASAAEFYQTLDTRLRLLVSTLQETDPAFKRNLVAVDRAYSNYFTVRDEMLRQAQVHKLSAEYTHKQPLNQPSTSTARLIYSHQPTISPLLVTLNAALDWYNALPAGANATRMRDVQLAAQLDRRLGQIPRFGNAVATFGVYYQWMKEDALITIPSGDVAPGSGIVLAGAAAKLLGTKGHIAVVQGKLAVPVSNVVKVPVSVTWSNRKELIKERDLRGQVGLTLDLDALFH
jgi:hypothetical protein